MNESSLIAPIAELPVVDLARVARAVRELLLAVGEDPDREAKHGAPMTTVAHRSEVMKLLDRGGQ